MNAARILIVENEAIIALEIKNSLKTLGYVDTSIVDTAEKAIRQAELDKPDIILMDVRINGEMDGIEAADIIRSRWSIPIVFSTAFLDDKRIERMKLSMPFGYILKPIHERELRITIEMALHNAKVEAERKKVENRFKVFFRAVNDAIMVHSFQEEGFAPFIEVNDIACKRYGYTREEFLALTPKDISKAVDADRHAQRNSRAKLFEERQMIFEAYHIRKNGEVFPVEINSNIIEYSDHQAILSVVRDITERKQAEEALRKSEQALIQTEKMMSIGGMAAGMAHEINNPLGGMLQGVQTIKRRLFEDIKANIEAAEETDVDLNKLRLYMEKRDILTFLESIQESGKKAADIIANMLQFSRTSESQFAPTNITKLIDKVLDLAGKDYNLKKHYDFRNIRIIKDFEPELPKVPCTETELEQVLINLLNNAAWAMHDSGSRKQPQIRIRVSTEEQKVRIEIEDNGPGMDRDIRRKIFEPFFTTKPVGEGTGLGLSVSYMIITNNHQGTMEVASTPGQGSSFIIKLPLSR